MSRILKVVPLDAGTIRLVGHLEKNAAGIHAAYEAARKEYAQAMEQLLEKHDPNYKANKANSMNLYRGQIQDGCLVITLE